MGPFITRNYSVFTLYVITVLYVTVAYATIYGGRMPIIYIVLHNSVACYVGNVTVKHVHRSRPMDTFSSVHPKYNT